MTDNLHVYGAHCAWHGTIADTARNGQIPVCPHCGSVLFQTQEDAWWAGVKNFNNINPGYEELIRWSQHPKHFASFKDVIAAYNAETGKGFKL